MAKKVDLKTITDIAVLVGTGISLYYLVKTLIYGLDPPSLGRAKEQEASRQWSRLIEANPELKKVHLSHYEKLILASVVTPSDIDVTFSDIGGLEPIIADLHESVIYPLTMPEVYSNSSLLQAPNGVLLYGPPGCGKTMLAKALAKESGTNFISIRMSSIMDKWYGESNKIVDAIFSLSNKIEPCIIFIDEIDSFLRERSSMDHEVTASLKAGFMTLWDGLLSNGRILVVGATNRIADIDSAFLRRLPKRFYVSLPGFEQRKKILEVLLRDTDLDEDKFSIDAIAEATEGLSGSDLKELCREAAMVAAKEYIRKKRALLSPRKDGTTLAAVSSEQAVDGEEDLTIRPLRTEDFITLKRDASVGVGTTTFD